MCQEFAEGCQEKNAKGLKTKLGLGQKNMRSHFKVKANKSRK